MAVEPLEALGEVLDDLLRDWREALPQDVVEPLLVQLVRELRASQLQQGPPQDGIPGGTQAIEGVVNRRTVSLTVGVQGPGRPTAACAVSSAASCWGLSGSVPGRPTEK